MQPSVPIQPPAATGKVSRPVRWFLVIHVGLTLIFLIPQFIFMVRGATTVDIIGFDTAFGRVECWSFGGRGMMVLRNAPPGPPTWETLDRVKEFATTADTIIDSPTSWTVMGLTASTNPRALHIALWWLAVNTAIQGALPFATIWMFRRSAAAPSRAAPSEATPSR